MPKPKPLLPERLITLANVVRRDGINGRQFRRDIEQALRDAHAFITLPPTDADVEAACRAGFDTLRAEEPVPGGTAVPSWEEVLQSNDPEDVENTATVRRLARAMLTSYRG